MSLSHFFFSSIPTGGGALFTFADAISRYRANLLEADLGEAYKRAGNAFKGQLQQTFVVLHDGPPGEADGSSVLLRSSVEANNIGKKRAREGECQVAGVNSPAKQSRVIKK